MSRFAIDVKHGFKTLRRGRGVTAFAVLAFALGIGITTAVFALFYRVLLKPFPYPDPDRLVLVYDVQPACKTCPASYEKYIDWTDAEHVVSGARRVADDQRRHHRRRRARARARRARDAHAGGECSACPRDRPLDCRGRRGAVAARRSSCCRDGYWRRRFAADPQRDRQDADDRRRAASESSA